MFEKIFSFESKLLTPFDWLSSHREGKMENQGTNGFVPNVIRRIMTYAHPADQVLSKQTHWQLRSVACEELHHRLAAPKYGMLLLKWPLCFHSKEDIAAKACSGQNQYSYIELLRYNLERALKPSTVAEENKLIERVQVFLAGYETMVLNEISRGMHMYTGLTTLVISLGLSLSFRLDIDDVHYEFAHYRDIILPYKKTELNVENQKQMLFINGKAWAQTIAAVMDQCSPSLLHLVFDDSGTVYQQLLSYQLPEEYDVIFAAKLPYVFYRTLQFDRKLAHMQHLQTLYFPTICQYERAFSPNKPCSARAWKALHRLKAAERLPNLKRVVISSNDKLFTEAPTKADKYAVKLNCGLPEITAPENLLVEAVGDKRLPAFVRPWLLSRLYRLKFPKAQISDKTRSQQWQAFHVEQDENVRMSQLDKTDFSSGNSSPDVEKWPTCKQQFMVQLLTSIATYSEKREKTMSVWNHVHAAAARADNRMMQPKVEIKVGIDQDQSVNATLVRILGGYECSFIDILAHEYARPRIVLDFDERQARKHKCKTLLEMLPQFDTVIAEDHMPLSTCAIENAVKWKIEMSRQEHNLNDFITFVRNECDSKGLVDRLYNLPPVELVVYPEIDANEESWISRDLDKTIDFIEAVMLKIITELINDAVVSCRAAADGDRGLKFSMYQKLSRVVYHFYVRQVVSGPTVYKLGHDRCFHLKFFDSKFNRFMSARQEKFRQKVWDKIFTCNGGYVGGSEGDEEQETESACKTDAPFKGGLLPLPSLKHVQILYTLKENTVYY